MNIRTLDIELEHWNSKVGFANYIIGTEFGIVTLPLWCWWAIVIGAALAKASLTAALPPKSDVSNIRAS